MADIIRSQDLIRLEENLLKKLEKNLFPKIEEMLQENNKLLVAEMKALLAETYRITTVKSPVSMEAEEANDEFEEEITPVDEDYPTVNVEITGDPAGCIAIGLFEDHYGGQHCDGQWQHWQQNAPDRVVSAMPKPSSPPSIASRPPFPPLPSLRPFMSSNGDSAYFVYLGKDAVHVFDKLPSLNIAMQDDRMWNSTIDEYFRFGYLKEGQDAYANVELRSNNIYLAVVLGLDKDSGWLNQIIRMDQPRVTVHEVLINSYIRTDESHGFRALIVKLLLLQQGAVVHQEGLAAVFGNGLSTTWVVNMGAQATSVIWAENGVVVPNTEKTLLFDGENISRCLLWAQRHHQTWPQIRTDILAKPIDLLMLNRLRESYCEIRGGDVDAVVVVHSYDDGMATLKIGELVPNVSSGIDTYIRKLAMEAGLSNGVLNIVHRTNVVFNAIRDDDNIRAISFVGFNTAGMHVNGKASAKGNLVQSNMGAKNHAICLPDANMDAPLNALVAAGFGAAGQHCMALSTEVIVEDSLSWECKLVELAKALNVNAVGTEPDADLGPFISKEAKERIHRLVQNGVESGARLLLDGRDTVVPGYEQGNFWGPIILSGVTTNTECYKEEIFEPVLLCMQPDSIEEPCVWSSPEIGKQIFHNGSLNMKKTLALGDWAYVKLQRYKQQSLAQRRSQKLKPVHLVPYQIEKKIGPLAYKLKFSTHSEIQPLFHISQPRQKVPNQQSAIRFLPNSEGKTPIPAVVSDCRMVRKENQAAAKILIFRGRVRRQKRATGKWVQSIQHCYPSFNLETRFFKGSGMICGEVEGSTKRIVLLL